MMSHYTWVGWKKENEQLGSLIFYNDTVKLKNAQ